MAATQELGSEEWPPPPSPSWSLPLFSTLLNEKRKGWHCRAGNQEQRLPSPQAVASGKPASALSQSAPLPMHMCTRKWKPLLAYYELFHLQMHPGEDAKRTQHPSTSRNPSSDKQERSREEGWEEDHARPRRPQNQEAPPQAHPPSSRGTAVRPHRGCLWTQQAKVTPSQSSRTPQPYTLSQLAGSGVSRKHFGDHSSPRKRLSRMLTNFRLQFCPPTQNLICLNVL